MPLPAHPSAEPAVPARAETLAHLMRVCRSHTLHQEAAIPTGHPPLDARLPGGGWPVGAITELLCDTTGLGELSLFLPALARLARAGRYIVWVAPPWLPYAPALAQRGLPLERTLVVRPADPLGALWALEQALRCPSVGAVLGWPSTIVDKQVRRLQLAAQAGGSLGILYRPDAVRCECSPAALRLRLIAGDPTCHAPVRIEIHKARGGVAGWQCAWANTSPG